MSIFLAQYGQRFLGTNLNVCGHLGCVQIGFVEPSEPIGFAVGGVELVGYGRCIINKINVLVSEQDESLALLVALTKVVSSALGRNARFDESTVFLLRENRFYHGNPAVAGRVVLFFYFKEANTGIAALIPGVHGAMDVARFRLTAGLLDPKCN